MIPDPHDTYLIYDGECPACRNYVRFVRFRDTVGTLHLIDARKAPSWVLQMQQRNMPLDDGMVLIFNGRYFHGADAIHHMALLSSGSGLFNRINAQLFRSRSLSRFLYPILKACRNALLFLLGKKPLKYS
ncbi:DUF393 domain-containing protein [Alcanivorax sp.]|uniref:thiol-disulfide oxidoreductase DCC family protein n=1 Tax=Alcanivorax sp. TaxID=1872427 RepID=UPI000C5FE545|nr:DUF393 domain-containing protein [Alcanivorax sp.]MBQ24364.1 hypothetical protein [Alcanivorax sp.]|tara:strand:+ start:157 stop:546 length:390 start_codon:yes stop_codon:yes gene_type:complete